MRIGTKQSKKKRYSPQIGGVMVSHHNMVSPQNGDTRGAPLATPLGCCYDDPIRQLRKTWKLIAIKCLNQFVRVHKSHWGWGNIKVCIGLTVLSVIWSLVMIML